MFWHIGNTTVRTPYRLREALLVLQNSPLTGDLKGKEKERSFAYLLHENEVLQITENRLRTGDYDDLGRKWRAALSQLGFITPSLPSSQSTLFADQGDTTPISFSITENGNRLISSAVVPAQQECFLRSLLAYQIPSILEHSSNYSSGPFVPLKFVVDVLFQLDLLGADRYISFDEFALYIQTTTPEEDIEEIAGRIIALREERRNKVGSLRSLMQGYYKSVAVEVGKVPGTLKDYADCSLRYLKATGLFRSKGRGIQLNPSREELATLINEQEVTILDDHPYLKKLWKGAELPTDQEGASIRVIRNLLNQIRNKGIEPPRHELQNKSEADLNIIRHELEELIQFIEEQEYADQQPNQIEEIIAWLRAFVNRSNVALPSGETITFPKSEAPAYFEWIIWRAFLAINSLTNAPWEARNFNIDQDFLPISHAPGGGPDMVFEFEDAIIVVEVTLTSSSRQEAAEGEPVRRHVAKFAEEYQGQQKRVYGLFIAVDVDTNTAHTFRHGDWYLRDDRRINLNIVPLALNDFTTFFSYGRTNIDEMAALLKKLMVECRALSNNEAPIWKQEISEHIASTFNR